MRAGPRPLLCRPNAPPRPGRFNSGQHPRRRQADLLPCPACCVIRSGRLSSARFRHGRRRLSLATAGKTKEDLMHARPRYALLTALALLAAQVATAEPLGPHFTLTPFGGYTMWDGSFRYPQLYPLTDIVYAGGRF